MSSINYLEKSYNEIFLALLFGGYDNGNGILSSDALFMDYVEHGQDLENSIIIFYASIATVIRFAYEDLTAIYDSLDIYLAHDEDLDKLGYLFFERLAAQKSITEVVYHAHTPPSTNITIPLGHQTRTDDSYAITFETIEDAILPAGMTDVTVGVRCLTAGPIGNVYPLAIDTLVTNINGINSVSNPQGAYGGTLEESDNSYRQRLLNWDTILAKGTYNAVVDAISKITSCVGYYISPFWDGYGSTKIVIDPPMQTVIDLVKASVELVKAVDEDYTFVMVETVPVDISCEINVSLDLVIPTTEMFKQKIEALVRQFTKIYLDGGLNRDGSDQKALGIGNDFVPYLLGTYLREQIPEIKNIIWSDENPITIENHEKAVSGTINITVV